MKVLTQADLYLDASFVHCSVHHKVCLVISLVTCSSSQCSNCILIHWWWVVRVSSRVQWSKYCPIWSTPNSKHQNRKLFLFWICESKCSYIFRCIFGFENPCVLSPSASEKHTKSSWAHCLSHILIWNCGTIMHCVVSPEASQLSTDQVHHNQVARCGKRLEFRAWSWSICQLCLWHTSDNPLCEVWCK